MWAVLLVASLIVSDKKERIEHCCYVVSLENDSERITIYLQEKDQNQDGVGYIL